MRTVLIYHAGDELTRQGFARWLGSFTDLAGVVEIHEDGSRAKQRIRAEIRRSGLLRFLFDVLPYRIYSRVKHAGRDREWERSKISELVSQYPASSVEPEILQTDSPNSAQTRDFIARLAPEMIVARCKTLIREEIFSLPRDGILILHPGVCPEYRNAHGCFWALANNEPDKVGMTLLKIDAGIDTGPVYGYFSYPFDVLRDTPAIIQARVVYDNLAAISEKIMEIHDQTATPLDTKGRASGVWGQPWLSKYFTMLKRAKSQ